MEILAAVTPDFLVTTQQAPKRQTKRPTDSGFQVTILLDFLAIRDLDYSASDEFDCLVRRGRSNSERVPVEFDRTAVDSVDDYGCGCKVVLAAALSSYLVAHNLIWGQ